MIKNYTSGVSPEISVFHIEKALVSHGAKNIMKTYDPEGHLNGLLFVMNVHGREMPFMLRAELDRVAAKMMRTIKRPHRGTLNKIKEQAGKTAWKIIYDEVDIKMTRIDLEQIELLEAFMTNIYDGARRQTLFDKVKDGSLKLLGE